MTISIEIEELYIRNGSGKMTCVQLQKPVVSIECAAEARKVALRATEAALAVLKKGIDLRELNAPEGKFGARSQTRPQGRCPMARKYTAQEMRDYADAIADDLGDSGHGGVRYFYNDLITVVEALRQAADDLEREEKREMPDEFSAEIQKLTDELYEVRQANIRLKAELNKDDCLKLANDVDHLRAENIKIIAERNELAELNRKCCDENERLKAALKPILAMRREDFDCGAEYAVNCGVAVDKANIIYEEGERK